MTRSYHEPPNELSAETRSLHRAMMTLIEEMEAVDWYHQRMEAERDQELRLILKHNRDEEMEHAAMALEWLRRRIPELDEELRSYLFTSDSIVETEGAQSSTGGQAADAPDNQHGDLGIGKP